MFRKQHTKKTALGTYTLVDYGRTGQQLGGRGDQSEAESTPTRHQPQSSRNDRLPVYSL